jgi:hypothetical protein
VERSRSGVCGSSLVRGLEGVWLEVVERNRFNVEGSSIRGGSGNLAWGRIGSFASGRKGVWFGVGEA